MAVTKASVRWALRLNFVRPHPSIVRALRICGPVSMSVRHLRIVAVGQVAEADKAVANEEADCFGPSWLWFGLSRDIGVKPNKGVSWKTSAYLFGIHPRAAPTRFLTGIN